MLSYPVPYFPITVKNNSCFRYTHTCFGYDGKTGKERNFVFFKNYLFNYEHIESSRGDPFISMVVQKLILKNNLIKIQSSLDKGVECPFPRSIVVPLYCMPKF